MTDTTAPRGFTGWHMLALMLTFFGIVIGVNVYLSVEAVRTWTGLVVDKSQEAGLDFNDKVQRAERQAALGWTSTLEYTSGHLRFTLHNQAGAPIGPSGVIARITRPLGDREDKTVDLPASADGAFDAPAALPAGAWNIVVIAADTSEGAYERRDRIVVP